MKLRLYQREAIDAIYRHLRERDDNPCAVLPTASGKTPVMATICREAVGRWNGRVVILAHVKELLQQAADKLDAICPEIHAGVYSAGLGRRDTEHPVIVAGIQSVYKRAEEIGSADLLIVDEAHLIPPDGEGMYQTFIEEMRRINGRIRVIGLTATPFRMTTGRICGPDNILNHVCYEVGVKELIVKGYLCPLVSKSGKNLANLDGVHVRGGEFVAAEAEDAMDQHGIVSSACAEIVDHSRDRKAVLIFACGIGHALHIVDQLEKLGIAAGFVCGDTPAAEREDTLLRFKQGRLKYLVNVNVLTTGFDAPNIDCVSLVRPTLSPGLYYQMVGRGFRLHPDKQNCLVLDFGGNVLRHGPVDALRVDDDGRTKTGKPPAKECPECHTLIAVGFAVCPGCGFQFPPQVREKEVTHDPKASDASILSVDVDATTTRKVDSVAYWVHKKKGAEPDAKKTLRVEYRLGWRDTISEWICVEHGGRPGMEARNWWAARTDAPFPASAEEASRTANAGELREAEEVTVRHKAGERWDRIVAYKLKENPRALYRLTPEEAADIPF